MLLIFKYFAIMAVIFNNINGELKEGLSNKSSTMTALSFMMLIIIAIMILS